MLNSTKLITNLSSKSPVAEAYKTLRTNIQYSSLDRQMKVIMVTSAFQSEGKSTTAANLAVTMALSEKRILLIDCDFRKPAIHRVFGLINAKGLTNVLAQSLDFRMVANTVEVDNLEVLTSGPKPPNPSELLGSSRMDAFISTVCAEYDMVIIDAPPVLPVTDAAVLARLTDGVILVVSHGGTTHEAARNAKEALEKVDAKIIGVVINNTPHNKSSRYQYYYYYDSDTDRRHRRKKSKRQKSDPGLKRITL